MSDRTERLRESVEGNGKNGRKTSRLLWWTPASDSPGSFRGREHPARQTRRVNRLSYSLLRKLPCQPPPAPSPSFRHPLFDMSRVTYQAVAPQQPAVKASRHHGRTTVGINVFRRRSFFSSAHSSSAPGRLAWACGGQERASLRSSYVVLHFARERSISQAILGILASFCHSPRQAWFLVQGPRGTSQQPATRAALSPDADLAVDWPSRSADTGRIRRQRRTSHFRRNPTRVRPPVPALRHSSYTNRLSRLPIHTHSPSVPGPPSSPP